MNDQSLIAAAREAFLHEGVESADVRPATLRAWKRAKLGGVRPDTEPAVVFASAMNPDSALLRAVRPVVHDIMAQLGTAEFAMMVTDRDAYIADRWVSSTSMGTLLDGMGVLKGARFDEATVGSTGLGTVLEERAISIVDGAEHFNRCFDPVVAVGVPVIRPGSGTIEGVLDLVCPTGAPHEVLAALVERAARDAGDRLLSGYAADDRALLDAFLHADRRGSRRPVIALNDRIIMANTLASALVGARYSHDQLWESVQRTIALGGQPLRLTASDGSPIDVGLRLVHHSGDVAGALLQLSTVPTKPTRPSPTSDSVSALVDVILDELPGRSWLWRSAVHAAARAGTTEGRLLLYGSPGVGKTALAGAVTGNRVAIAGTASEGRLLGDLTHRGSDELASLGAELDAHDRGFAVATLTADRAEDIDPRLLTMFEYVVEVPDLSRRPEDVGDLAETLIRRLSAGTVGLAVPTIRELCQRDWRGNIAQLHRTLRAALDHTTGPRLQPADLPTTTAQTATHKRLSHLEQAEREAIAAALRRAKGNRLKTAEALGISRATLYRKLAALGLG
ncbi:sigma-54-dependent Fis family transcriptional regulator [Nocardia salmonicida]|uniref:sigma-54-dependent Fis family transcriptional regulator n=1 Tax=Nocardia salmonicida TaxID=53431 RepID=UPI00363942AB